jgi:hypothetical protein
MAGLRGYSHYSGLINFLAKMAVPILKVRARQRAMRSGLIVSAEIVVPVKAWAVRGEAPIDC